MPPPDEIFASWQGPTTKSFTQTIRETFQLPENDPFVYSTEGFSMTLAQIQELLNSDKMEYQYYSHGEVVQIPDQDISVYTNIFSPSASTPKALTAFVSNAKKGSPREKVAQYLLSKRLVPANTTVPRSKKHTNPYYDIWASTCRLTSFLGPLPDPGYADPAAAKVTHPILPVLYHHFGCVCPSYEALWVISSLAKGKEVLEIGSGNGYWDYMLRQVGTAAIAVDSTASLYRYSWVGDTVVMDGGEYLKGNGGAKGKVLLLVYPVTLGGFTAKVIGEYKGNTIVIVGTQNANRFTGFSDRTVEEYFEATKEWELTWRVPLPSFAGKDDAMFVWQKRL